MTKSPPGVLRPPTLPVAAPGTTHRRLVSVSHDCGSTARVLGGRERDVATVGYPRPLIEQGNRRKATLELDTAFDQHQTAVNADPAAVKEARRRRDPPLALLSRGAR
jgi:hypothetical protein